MIKLDVEQVIYLHEKLIQRTGGKDGPRDKGILESALFHVYATFDGKDLYPTIEEKAARQMFALVSGHPFVDGNKRIGVFVMLIFLEMNEIKIKYTQEELVKLALGTASGKIDANNILTWIKSHSAQ